MAFSFSKIPNKSLAVLCFPWYSITKRMSSLEIAEVTGKEHAHVMRDIRNQFIELDIDGQSIFGDSYINAQNKKQPMFSLDEEQTMILAI